MTRIRPPNANLSRKLPSIPQVSAFTLQTIVIPNRLQPVRNLLFCPLGMHVGPNLLPNSVIPSGVEGPASASTAKESEGSCGDKRRQLHFAGSTETRGAPSFAPFAKGGSVELHNLRPGAPLLAFCARGGRINNVRMNDCDIRQILIRGPRALRKLGRPSPFNSVIPSEERSSARGRSCEAEGPRVRPHR
jgi:hypothetical protein